MRIYTKCFFELALKLAPSLLLMYGFLLNSSASVTVALSFFSFMILANIASHSFRSSVIPFLMKRNYSWALPQILLKSLDVYAVGVLCIAGHPFIGIFYALSCAMTWTLMEDYEQFKNKKGSFSVSHPN